MTHERRSVKTRPVRSAPPPLAKYTRSIFAGLAKHTSYIDPALSDHWSGIVGREIADLCRPGRLRGGRTNATLELVAISSAAAAAVQFHDGEIRSKVNAYFGANTVARISVTAAAARHPNQSVGNATGTRADDGKGILSTFFGADDTET
ncbi:MAG: DciA family protein [Pseudomonadota bacterium]